MHGGVLVEAPDTLPAAAGVSDFEEARSARGMFCCSGRAYISAKQR